MIKRALQSMVITLAFFGLIVGSVGVNLALQGKLDLTLPFSSPTCC